MALQYFWSNFVTILLACVVNINGYSGVNVSLMNKLEAPLKAEFDISALTTQIKALVEHEVEQRMHSFVERGLDRVEQTVEAAKRAFQSEINDTVDFLNHQKKDKIPAFTATFSQAKMMTLVKGEMIKFDKVHLDTHGAYDPTSGYFMAPYPGIYLVACTVRSNGGKHLHVFLWKNNQRLALAYGSNWNTGSLQMVLKLAKGDKLYIKHDSGEYVKNEDIQGGDTSMFSVVFIS